MRLYDGSGSGSGSAFGFVKNMLVAFVGSMMLGSTCSPSVVAQTFAGPSPLYLHDFSAGVVSNKLLDIQGGQQPTKIPNTWTKVVVGESIAGSGSMSVSNSSRFFYDPVSSTIRQLWGGDSTSYLCLDSAGDKNELIIGQCLFNGNQLFEVNPVGSPLTVAGPVTVQFKLKSNGYCLDYTTPTIGTQIKLTPCNTNSQTQRFYVPTYIPANTAFTWYDPSPVYAAPLGVVSSSRFGIGGPFNGPNWANIVLTQSTVFSSVLFEYVNNTSQLRQFGSTSCIDSAGNQNRLIFGECLGANGNQIIDIIPFTTTGLIKIQLRQNGYCADYTNLQPNQGQIVKFITCDINSQTQTFYVPTYRTSLI